MIFWKMVDCADVLWAVRQPYGFDQWQPCRLHFQPKKGSENAPVTWPHKMSRGRVPPATHIQDMLMLPCSPVLDKILKTGKSAG